MQFKVTIDFRKGPSFEALVYVSSKSNAELSALNLARQHGFDGAPKKITVRPV